MVLRLDMVSNVYNATITDDERVQVYRQILRIFLSSGGSTKDGKDDEQENVAEGCGVRTAEP